MHQCGKHRQWNNRRFGYDNFVRNCRHFESGTRRRCLRRSSRGDSSNGESFGRRHKSFGGRRRQQSRAIGGGGAKCGPNDHSFVGRGESGRRCTYFSEFRSSGLSFFLLKISVVFSFTNFSNFLSVSVFKILFLHFNQQFSKFFSIFQGFQI